MAKTSIATLITRIKRRVDYDNETSGGVTDTNLDNLIVDIINDCLKQEHQWFLDEGMYREISESNILKTVPNQAYIELETARIVGDKTTFTGQAGDTIKVIIDGTTYDDIDISGDTSIANVVTSINTAVGSTVASETSDGYLAITSLTTGGASSVTISDGTSTAQTVIAELFSVSDERSSTALNNVDEIIRVSERTNDQTIDMIDYRDFVLNYTDPTLYTDTVPDEFAVWDERLYLGPTPSATKSIYIANTFIPTDVTSSSTCPFRTKYDPLLTAMAEEQWQRYFNAKDRAAIKTAEELVARLYKQFIVMGAKNIGLNRQVKSRRESNIIAPQRPIGENVDVSIQ